jgi:hypothetical protein
VVVQIGADAGRVPDHVDAALAQQLNGTDARQLQDLRRADRAGREYHFAARAEVLRRPAGETHGDANRARRAVVPVSEHALDERARAHGEVRALQRGPQKRLGRAPAAAAALIHLEIGIAEVIPAIELRDLRDAALLGGVAPGVEHIPAHAALLDAQLAVRSMKLVRAVLVALRPLEHRQHVVP